MQARKATDLLYLAAPAGAVAVLAAHFYRAAAWPLVAACLALVMLLAWPRPWVARLTQAALLAGAFEWGWTAFQLVQQRIALGRPWGRLVLILGLVALLTAAAALVFRHPGLRARFGLGPR